MRRARLARHALWQMLDFAVQRGIALGVIGALLLTQLAIAVRLPSSGGGPGARLPDAMLLRMGWSVFWTFAFLAVLTAVNGLVSTDRRQGYFRFLFSKPVAIPAYYAFAFGVGLAGVVVFAVLMHLALWWAAGVRLPVHVLLPVPLLYLLLGGIGFFFSTVMNREWLGILALIIATLYLRHRAVAAGGAAESLARYLLPPLHLQDAFRDAALAGAAPDMSLILWPAVYGAAVFAGGLLVLRRRAMGS